MSRSGRGINRKHKVVLILLVSLPSCFIAWFMMKDAHAPLTGKLGHNPQSKHEPKPSRLSWTRSAARDHRTSQLPPARIASTSAIPSGCVGPYPGYIATDLLPSSTTFRYADVAAAACNQVPSCTGFVLGTGETARYSLRTGPALRKSPSGEVAYCCSIECRATVANATTPEVLILSPVKNAVAHLERFFNNLYNLSFPLSHISVAMLDASDNEETKLRIEAELPRADAKGLKELKLFRSPHLAESNSDSTQLVGPDRHSRDVQPTRRARLARERNLLLSNALRQQHDWVLWLDVDVHRYNSNLIQTLLEAGKDIVAPNVVMPIPSRRSYDLNSWRLSSSQQGVKSGEWASSVWTSSSSVDELIQAAQQQLKAAWISKGEIAHMAEQSAANTERWSSREQHQYLSDLRNGRAAKVVELEGVGGAVLMVRAALHREGLIFPPFSYKGRMETEGLAVMARDMGVRSFGLPYEETEHL